MCRHLAYLGPPTTLAALLLDPPHGLLHQSYAPADMRGGGTVNADGFGAGWYPPAAARPSANAPTPVPGAALCGEPGTAAHPAAAAEGAAGRPARYRSDRPIWADTAFAALAAVTTGTAVLAAVRSATTGLPVTAPAAAPFGEGRWLFSHNGLIRGWPGAVAGLAAELPVTDLLTLDAPTDSALLWALVRHRLRAGDDPAAVLAGVVRAVAAAAPGSRLNLLLTDGAAVWATTWTHALSVRVGAGAVTVVSEPSDGNGGWVAVPDRHLVVATPHRCDVHPLDAATTTPVTDPPVTDPAAGVPAA
ncbi:MAG: ergothioneine biosynthesis protein EgtC [Pseudonocardia sp.]